MLTLSVGLKRITVKGLRVDIEDDEFEFSRMEIEIGWV
jgi:hypothetical protein